MFLEVPTPVSKTKPYAFLTKAFLYESYFAYLVNILQAYYIFRKYPIFCHKNKLFFSESRINIISY